MAGRVYSVSDGSPSWKKHVLHLIISFLVIIGASGQDVKLNSEMSLNIQAISSYSLRVEWQHLIQKGNIDLIEEVELRQKVGKKWNSILTLNPTEPLVVDTFPICKAHQKFTVSITPKFGKECHPYCSSTFSDYKPIQYFEDKTPPYSCIKNATTLSIQLNDNMVTKDIFSKCIQNVKIYEDGELSKFKGKVTLLDSVTIDIELDESVKFYDLVYEAINLDTEKTSTILSKRLSPNWENYCEIPTVQSEHNKKLNDPMSSPASESQIYIIIGVVIPNVIMIIIMITTLVIYKYRRFICAILISSCPKLELEVDADQISGPSLESNSQKTETDNNRNHTGYTKCMENNADEKQTLIDSSLSEPKIDAISSKDKDINETELSERNIEIKSETADSELEEWQTVGPKKGRSPKAPSSYFLEVKSDPISPDRKIMKILPNLNDEI